MKKAEFSKAVAQRLEKGLKDNKKSLEKLAKSFGIVDPTWVKELTELAIVNYARELAHTPGTTQKERFKSIVALYYQQSNLSLRTSESILMQQYSTPAPIGYLCGLFTNADKKDISLFEPSAGNGLLTISADPKRVTVNELDPVRSANLQTQGYAVQLNQDASEPFAGMEKKFTAVITNPPFGALDKSEYAYFGNYKIKALEHLMVIRALETMQDNGRFAAIIGGNHKYNKDGRLGNTTKDGVFFNYLYHHYKVVDVINISGKHLYSRQGTGFPVRMILIDGRKQTPNGFSPDEGKERDQQITDFNDLWSRVAPHLSTPTKLSTKMLALKAKALKVKLQLIGDASLGAPYMPSSNACVVLNTIVPDAMEQETRDALEAIRQAVGGDIDKFVQHRCGYATRTELCNALAAEQIDAVAMAIYNIEAREQGMVIADQTGIGKGRQASAIIKYARTQGKRPVFVTEKPNLFTDLYRDMIDIGIGHYEPFIINSREKKTSIINTETKKEIYNTPPKKEQDEIIRTGVLPEKYSLILCTYDQFATEQGGKKHAFLRAMAYDSIVIMDEAHNASGNSFRGLFMQEIAKAAQGVTFLSATFAKTPEAMPLYAMKTAMNDANMQPEDLVNAIKDGGVALQEVLSSQLVSEGQLIRRERPMDDVEVNYIYMDATADEPSFNREQEHAAIADNITEIIRRIIGFQEAYVSDEIKVMQKTMKREGKEIKERGGTSKAGVDNPPMFSKVFNLVNQMLFSIKADAVADRAIYRLRQGKKPVIAFSSTMESFLKEMGNDRGEALKMGDEINTDFSLVLRKAMGTVLKYTVTGHDGEKEFEEFSPGDLGVDAVEEYHAILNRIASASSGICISPIDYIKQKIERAGYKVAEVTGRTSYVELAPDAKTGVFMTKPKQSTASAFTDFNNNVIDVLMINQSGSTGASAHAVPVQNKETGEWIVAPHEVKQRCMIVLQPELDINTEIQKRGRVNRTGQIMHPIYDYIISAIPAEKRLMMMLQKKLKSLDANSSGNQKNSQSIMDFPDFLNKIGDKVVYDYLLGKFDLNAKLGDPLKLNAEEEDGKKKPTHYNTASPSQVVSGRVAVLSCDMQKEFYDEIMKAYNKKVDDLKSEDKYDLEVEAMNLQAETKKQEVVIVGKNANSVFGSETFLETCSVNVLRKPFTKAELDNIILKATGDKSPAQYSAELRSSYQEFASKNKATELEKIRAKFLEKYEAVPRERDMKAIKDEAEREQAIKDKQNAIHELANEKLNDANTKWSEEIHTIERILKFFVPGKSLRWPLEGGSHVPAVFVGFKIDFTKSNPWAKSNIDLQFAIANGMRSRNLSLSADESEIFSILGVSSYLPAHEMQNHERWELLVKERSNSRTTRYIVTGNLLQGMARYDTGRLIEYTLMGGGVKKGILLPEKYEHKAVQKISTPIDAARKYIKSRTNGQQVATSNGLTITKQYDNYSLIVGSAKTGKNAGSWLYLDEKVRNMVEGRNFVKVSSIMRAMLPADQIDNFLTHMQAKHSLSVEMPDDYYDKQAIEKQPMKKLFVPEMEEAPQVDKFKLLRLKARAVKAKLQLLNLNSLQQAS